MFTTTSGYGDTVYIEKTESRYDETYVVYATRDIEIVGDDRRRTYWYADPEGAFETAFGTLEDVKKLMATYEFVAACEIARSLAEALKPLA